VVERNWAGNVAFRAERIEHPTNVDELREIVVAAERVRMVGTRHSFNEIADAEVMVSLDELPDEVDIDARAGTVAINPAMTYGQLATVLHGHGLALHNLASLPHISVGGAVATGTHGSGDRCGNLATAVSALEIMRSDGELVRLRRGDADFDGAVVNLGALGVVLQLQLDVEPEYEVTQQIFEGLAWTELVSQFDAITGAGDSVSLFTTYGPHVEQLWVKRRVPTGRDVTELATARPAVTELHPVPGVSAESCTPQLGLPGLWSDRLPHFKMGFTPSSGDELQSEVFVPRQHALGAIDVLRGLAGEMAEQLQISEIRTVAADQLWMSPHYRRDTVAFHFTWRPDVAKAMRIVARIESALAPFDPRPHWGKLSTIDGDTLASRYARHADFIDLIDRFDPRRAFTNPWLDHHL
jgi:xylitol oxidase